jgi:hypothetical protein
VPVVELPKGCSESPRGHCLVDLTDQTYLRDRVERPTSYSPELQRQFKPFASSQKKGLTSTVLRQSPNLSGKTPLSVVSRYLIVVTRGWSCHLGATFFHTEFDVQVALCFRISVTPQRSSNSHNGDRSISELFCHTALNTYLHSDTTPNHTTS